MAGYITEKFFSSPKELIKCLINNDKLWGGKRYNWVFRGHSDDGYKLIPSALREGANLGYSFNIANTDRSTNKDQIQGELEILQEFYWASDAQGLYLPGDVNLLRTPKNWVKIEKKINKNGWPIDDFLPLLALAQHYQLPTRLLDWSYKPLIAAFFAARKANTRNGNGKIGIWALDLNWVINKAFVGRGENKNKKLSVYVVTAPRHSNPNLHAQGGVFTTEEISQKYLNSSVNCNSVDQIIKDRCAQISIDNPVMMHFTLPTNKAGELLRLLAQEGISSSIVFPGFKGVADSIKETQLWDRKEGMSYWLPDNFTL